MSITAVNMALSKKQYYSCIMTDNSMIKRWEIWDVGKNLNAWSKEQKGMTVGKHELACE